MKTKTYDVVVVGGGPAGATAAYNLAKYGLHVALLEKEQIPRYKPCGGVVAPRVDSILDFSIEPIIERKVTDVKITVRLQNPFVTQSPYPFEYLVMRDKFDAFLSDKACQAGADVYSSSPLHNLSQSSDGYLLTTPTRLIKARYLIVADGANSVTRKLLEVPAFRRLSIAVEREIHGDSQLLHNWDMTIALDFGYLSSGFAWIFPKANNFSIGAGGPVSVAKELKTYVDRVTEHYSNDIGDTTPYIVSGHYLPIRTRGEKIFCDRSLFVGDAAGLIEPMAGEGIYYAIRSAQIAAETIADSIKKSREHLNEYERRIDEEIQPEIQVAKSLLYLLDLAPGYWVPRLMKPDAAFWKFFYRVFTGQKKYQDAPKKFGIFGRLFFALLDKWLAN